MRDATLKPPSKPDEWNRWGQIMTTANTHKVAEGMSFQDKAMKTLSMILRRYISDTGTLMLDEYEIVRHVEEVERRDHAGTFTSKTYEVRRGA